MIRLRPYKKEDDNLLLGWFSDANSFEKWSVGRFPYPLTIEALHQFNNEMEQDQNAFRLAATNEEGVLIGHIAFKHIDYKENFAYLGYIVLDPALRNQGLGHEMVSQAVKYAIQILGVDRVTLGVFSNNESAAHCYDAVGFHLEDIKKGYHTFEGESWDLYQLGIQKDMIL